MTRRITVMVRVAAAALGLYALACGIVASSYRRVLYPAPARVASDQGAKALEAKTSDGTIARALRFGASDAPLTIVVFHGNGELAGDNAAIARELGAHGYAVVLAEYRGYGISRDAGSPNERALYADAEAILDVLGVASDRVVLMGFSLGTGVAVEMAARGHGRALVLLAPFTSIPSVAAHHAPLLPMSLLVRDRFDSKAKASAIALPVLVLHGDADEVVPFDMGETIAHTFPKGRFVAVSGGHHADLFASGDHVMQAIVDFLIEMTPIE